MKNYNIQHRYLYQPSVYVFAIGCSLLAGKVYAETANGTASATVVSPAFVNLVTVRSVTERVSVSSPILRVEAPSGQVSGPEDSPSGASVGVNVEPGGSSAGNGNTVNVSLDPNGMLSVESSGNGLSFFVSSSAGNKVLVDYN